MTPGTPSGHQLLVEVLIAANLSVQAQDLAIYLVDASLHLVLAAEFDAIAVRPNSHRKWPPLLTFGEAGLDAHEDSPFGHLTPGEPAVVNVAHLRQLPLFARMQTSRETASPNRFGLVPFFWDGRLAGALMMFGTESARITQDCLRGLVPLTCFIGFALHWHDDRVRSERTGGAGQRVMESRLVQTHRLISAETLGLLNARRSLADFLREGLTSLVDALAGVSGAVWIRDEENHQLRKFIETGGPAGAGAPCADQEPCPSCQNVPFPPEGPWEFARTVDVGELDVPGLDVEPFVRNGIRWLVVIPLKSEPRVFGWLSIRFTRDVREDALHKNLIVDAIARMLSLAVELDQLVKHVRMSSKTAERRRLAREIHDTAAQDAASLLIMLRSLSTTAQIEEYNGLLSGLQNATDLVRKILRDMREGLATLRARRRDTGGFLEALKLTLEENPAPQKLQCRMEVHGQLPPMPPDIEIEVLRVAREAFNNARRHAQARNFLVTINVAENEVEFSFADDGRGFDPEFPTEGWGLIGMRERADRLRATLQLDSRPGSGSTIRLILPLTTVTAMDESTYFPGSEQQICRSTTDV